MTEEVFGIDGVNDGTTKGYVRWRRLFLNKYIDHRVGSPNNQSKLFFTDNDERYQSLLLVF